MLTAGFLFLYISFSDIRNLRMAGIPGHPEFYGYRNFTDIVILRTSEFFHEIFESVERFFDIFAG